MNDSNNRLKQLSCETLHQDEETKTLGLKSDSDHKSKRVLCVRNL